MAYYVEVMDVWSNVSYVGPFETKDSAWAWACTQPDRFNYRTITQSQMDSANAEYGDADCFNPDLMG